MSIAAVRGIGVAVITSTSGCGRRFRSCAGQQCALFDAEAVLLVDHDDAEAGERRVAVEQRVGAHDDVDLAPLEAGDEPPALGRGRAVGQQLTRTGRSSSRQPSLGTARSASMAVAER